MNREHLIQALARTAALASLTTLAAFTTGCSDQPTGLAESAQPADTLNPDQLKGAIRYEIDASTGSIRIGALAASHSIAGGPSFSLIGTNELSMQVVNTRRVVPARGKDTIYVDFRLINQLQNASLVPSTSPKSALPDSLVLAAVGMAQDPDTTRQPGYAPTWRGNVAPSGTAPRWDVLTGQMCRTGAACAPWMAVEPLGPNGASQVLTMGFVVPKTATSVIGYFYVGADIHESPLPPNDGPNTGSIAGTLSSPMVGPLAHIVVVADSAHKDTTSTSGTYAIGSLNPGSYTIKFQVPDYCYVPDTTVTVTAGIVTKLDRSGECQGTIVGRVTTISPTSGLVVGEPTLFMYLNGADAGLTGPTGRYTAYADAGLVAFDIKNPAGCVHQTPAPFTLAAGQTDTINIAVTCFGQVLGIVTTDSGPAAGATVTLTLGGSTLTATTAGDGSYSFLNIAAGINGNLVGAIPGARWCSAQNTFIVTTATTQANLNFYCAPAPVVITQALPHGQSGFPYGPVQLVASADSGLRWDVTQKNTTGVLISSTGVVTGTPEAAGEGTALIFVEVSDKWGRHSPVASIYFTIDIVAPQVVTTTLPDGIVGVPYTAQLVGYGYNLRWGQNGPNMPQGLTLSPSGLLSGTPTDRGVGLISVKLEDQFGNYTIANVGLRILNP